MQQNKHFHRWVLQYAPLLHNDDHMHFSVSFLHDDAPDSARRTVNAGRQQKVCLLLQKLRIAESRSCDTLYALQNKKSAWEAI